MVSNEQVKEGAKSVIGGIVWLLAMVLVLVAGCTSMPASDAKSGFLHLKVDFTVSSGQDNPKPVPGTTKDGW